MPIPVPSRSGQLPNNPINQANGPGKRGPFAFLDPYVELDPIEGLGWT